MKKFNFSKLFFVAALVASFVMLSGCKPAPDETKTTIYNGIFFIGDDDSLVGKWVDNTNAVYEIGKDSFKNYGEGYDSYAGNELCVKKDSNTSGIIYIKYTKAATANWTYSEDKNEAPDVGKWYAIAYKDLNTNTISISGAYKAGGKTSTATLKEAVEEFTIDKGYFGFYSECTKK